MDWWLYERYRRCKYISIFILLCFIMFVLYSINLSLHLSCNMLLFVLFMGAQINKTHKIENTLDTRFNFTSTYRNSIKAVSLQVLFGSNDVLGQVQII